MITKIATALAAVQAKEIYHHVDFKVLMSELSSHENAEMVLETLADCIGKSCAEPSMVDKIGKLRDSAKLIIKSNKDDPRDLVMHLLGFNDKKAPADVVVEKHSVNEGRDLTTTL